MRANKLLLVFIIISIIFLSGCQYNEQKKTSAIEPVTIEIYTNNTAVSNNDEEYTEIIPIEEDDEDKTTYHYDNQKPKGYKTAHYFLQATDFESLKNLVVDYLVIDYDDARLDNDQLSFLKSKEITVLSYLSIGEAEEYRDYWNDSWTVGNPGFIDMENPDWHGNYKVKYWYPEWQNIILNKAEIIANAGYDGLYLDIIDAYYYYEEQGRATAKDEMIQFVKKISEHCKEINPDFKIIPQNSPELYESAEYKKCIDGLGKESTWYVGDESQDRDETDYVLSILDEVIEDNKIVLAIDYPTEQNNICDFYNECRSHSFACTVSNRALDLEKPIICIR